MTLTRSTVPRRVHWLCMCLGSGEGFPMLVGVGLPLLLVFGSVAFLLISLGFYHDLGSWRQAEH